MAQPRFFMREGLSREAVATTIALPDATGDFGLWKRNQYDESADFVVSHFDPNAPSSQDGQAGTWKVCEGGTRYLNRRPVLGSGQLRC